MSARKESRTKSFLRLLRDGDCFRTYIFHLDFSDDTCGNALFKSMFGLQKLFAVVPQIWAIIENASGEGINSISAILDIFTAAIHFIYMYKSGSEAIDWIPPAIIATEMAAIPALIYHYNGEEKKAVGVAVGYLVSVFLLATIVPVEVLSTVKNFEIPILIASTALQMYTNYENQGTGNQSVASKAMSLSGNAEDVFIEAVNYYLDGGNQEDVMAIITASVKVLLDSLLVGQYVYLNRDEIFRD